MTLISYAQNFEDVILWRALKTVKNGFYIDVGAWDPDLDSVTRAFSEQGWHGVNIEPVPEKQARLRERRHRDINLATAVGAARGSLPFFEVTGTGLSTFDPGMAAQHAKSGYAVIERSVEQTTLAEICRLHAPAEIHFLKLDCEGHEEAALAGADFTRFRPWIVLAEATTPGTQEPAFAGWEPILLRADYRFAWFDGLNRFYIAAEHFDRLAPLVAMPPNCFDNFIRSLDLHAAQAAIAPPVWSPPVMSLDERIELAARCRDCDDLPKAAKAGQVCEENGVRVQIMHNGIRVPADGYCGPWMTQLIARCQGHHEPQEERQFNAALQALPGDATMIELGSNWAFYAAWFLQGAPARRAVLLEPDPVNRAVGEHTMALNGLRATFVAGTAGAVPCPPRPFITEQSGALLLPGFSVPQLMAMHGMARLDVLHCDTQGAELSVLTGCVELFRAGRIGFVFVSTHAPFISNDPLTHQKCLELLQNAGAVIEAEHDAWESFSGDGLIFARFGPPPAGWQPVPCSVARHRETLFRDPCYDLADAAAMGRSTSALLDGVVRGTFEKLLFREIDPVGLARSTALLQAGTDFGLWLGNVLESPEFKLKQDRFFRQYVEESAIAGPRAPPPFPAGGQVSCSALELRLERPTALGQPGDLLMIPNDRMILPAVLAAGAWLPEQLDFFNELLDKDTEYVLVDVGANIGLFSRQVLKAFPNIASAHCIEPEPANYRALCANLAGLEGTAVFTHRLALGAQAGTAAFFADIENCGNNSVHEDAMRDRAFAQSTISVTAAGPWLSALLPGAEPIIWKSDTQGNDEAIVAAIPWPIWRRVRVAMIELWRIQKPKIWISDFLERVADMPHRRLGTLEVSVEDVARYLESDDWTFEDLYLWR